MVTGISKKKRDIINKIIDDGIKIDSGEWLEIGSVEGLARNIQNSMTTFSLQSRRT